MTILMFGWEFPPHITGGLGTACFGLTKSLSLLGVDITFVVPKKYGDESSDVAKVVGADSVPITDEIIKSYYHNSNFKYLEINSTLIPYQTDSEYFDLINKSTTTKISKQENTANYFTFSGGYGRDLYSEVERYSIVAKHIAHQQNFDIIHCHDWLTYKAGIIAKKETGKPLVIHVHATEYDRSGHNNVNNIVYNIEKEGMDAADKIICVSNWTKNILIKYYNQPLSKILIVHNGIDKSYNPKVANNKRNKKIVTFLGRITHQKGPEYFVDTAFKLLEKDNDVHFVMVGSGDMYNKMIDKVATKGVSDKFHFTGFLRQAEVNKILSVSDVYVMPSVSEPFGISALEALEKDIPIVISHQSGVSEVVDNALKTDFWDTDTMADDIYALLHYKTLKKTITKEAKNDLEHLTWLEVAKKLKNLYVEMSLTNNYN